MVLGLTIIYAAVKFIDLYQGNDPNIRTNAVPDSYGPDDYLTFADDLKFRLAVGARKDDQTLFHDPQMMRWIAIMTSKDGNGKTKRSYLPLHDCT